MNGVNGVNGGDGASGKASKDVKGVKNGVKTAEIITIGDEILRGEIVDSNKALISERLLQLHIDTRFQTSVLDDPADMVDAIRRAVARCDIVLLSGGLGPTRDDMTTAVVADAFGRELVLDPESLETIRSFFARLGREMSDNNSKQAYFPEGAEILANPIGTAPGFMIHASYGAAGGEANGAGALLFAMPGVPRELERMMEEQVLPAVARRFGGGGVVRARLLKTFGLGESSLDEKLHHIAREEGVDLGFRTRFPDNYLRPVVRASSVEEAEEQLDGICREVRECLGALVYGEGDETMEAVVGCLLREQGKWIAVAESCTGGMIAEHITDVPGSSEYFAGGVVTYSNESKSSLLGVPEEVLQEYGAVSEPVAAAMAEGVRERFGSDFGVSTTGISGPGGGSDEKPVGLVYIGIARAGCDTHVEGFVFPLDRTRHRTLTAQVALDWVRRSLLGVELVGPSLLRQRGGAAPPGSGGA